jgi:hypothetical protein
MKRLMISAFAIIVVVAVAAIMLRPPSAAIDISANHRRYAATAGTPWYGRDRQAPGTGNRRSITDLSYTNKTLI